MTAAEHVNVIESLVYSALHGAGPWDSRLNSLTEGGTPSFSAFVYHFAIKRGQ